MIFILLCCQIIFTASQPSLAPTPSDITLDTGYCPTNGYEITDNFVIELDLQIFTWPNYFVHIFDILIGGNSAFFLRYSPSLDQLYFRDGTGTSQIASRTFTSPGDDNVVTSHFIKVQRETLTWTIDGVEYVFTKTPHTTGDAVICFPALDNFDSQQSADDGIISDFKIYPIWPTTEPTSDPTISPSVPSLSPSTDPTISPTRNPSTHPSISPTRFPSTSPSRFPTNSPSTNPSVSPTGFPSAGPTNSPSANPSISPTGFPSAGPTKSPSTDPTTSPSDSPTRDSDDSDDGYDIETSAFYNDDDDSASREYYGDNAQANDLNTMDLDENTNEADENTNGTKTTVVINVSGHTLYHLFGTMIVILINGFIVMYWSGCMQNIHC